MKKSITIQLTCLLVVLAIIFVMHACVKTNTCRVCKAYNASEQVVNSLEVCSDEDEDKFREEYNTYSVSCN